MDASNFDDIRPYYDSEIPSAMERIVSDSMFPIVAAYVMPGTPLEAAKRKVLSIKTARQLQEDIMAGVIAEILHKSSDGMTYEGLEHIKPDKAYLFISNHRDIMLDAAILQYILVTNNLPSTEITFGANLMNPRLVVDIGKSNRMFRVERPSAATTAREFYNISRHLSDYIRYTITGKNASVWIAQRNGRTKDGVDKTDQGVIKMLGLSAGGDRVKAMADLNITPMAISYEYEPCDFAKAMELATLESQGYYTKKSGEDLNSSLSGITSPKGRIHVKICAPLTEEDFAPFASLPGSGFNKAIANLLDSRIRPAYKPMPTAFIARDLLSGALSPDGGLVPDRASAPGGTSVPGSVSASDSAAAATSPAVTGSAPYTAAEVAAFLRHIGTAPANLRPRILAMYAAPINTGAYPPNP